MSNAETAQNTLCLHLYCAQCSGPDPDPECSLIVSRYIIKPSEGKNFVEIALDTAAKAKNETGFIYGKLFKVHSLAALGL